MELKNLISTYFKKPEPTLVTKLISMEARTLFHWKIVLTLFFLATATVFTGSYFIYQDISSGDFLLTKEKTTTNSSEASFELLSKTVDSFKIKSLTFEELSRSTRKSTDPSR